jgi:plasmid stabilization system protein ParE
VTIRWRLAALDNLETIERYIAERNPAAAARVKRRIRERIDQLADAPYLGRVGRVEKTRELVVSGLPYVVAYRVIDPDIEILAVLHGSRRWPTSF